MGEIFTVGIVGLEECENGALVKFTFKHITSTQFHANSDAGQTRLRCGVIARITYFTRSYVPCSRKGLRRIH